ncbi:MAG: hypothetical protein ACLQI7_15990 [Streptosporangiaceae bacterium]|jgi:hypothetical protein
MRLTRFWPAGGRKAGDQVAGTDDRYKWVALSNTTAAVFMSVLDGLHRHHRAAGDFPGHPP